MVLRRYGLRLKSYVQDAITDLIRDLPESLDLSDPAVEARVLSALCIGETTFLRHPDHFSTLIRLLPSLPLERGAELVALSAGCASGEEAYSLAATLSEHWGPRVRVIGLDLNPRFLEKARAGRYSTWSLRNARQEDLPWIECKGDRVSVAQSVMDKVEFRRANLMALPDLPPIHLAFCRNALMYFDPEAATQVYRGLAERVIEGGLLFSGYSDPKTSRADGWASEVEGNTWYFRRVLPRPPSPEGTPVETTEVKLPRCETRASLARPLPASERHALSRMPSLIKQMPAAIHSAPASTPLELGPPAERPVPAASSPLAVSALDRPGSGDLGGQRDLKALLSESHRLAQEKQYFEALARLDEATELEPLCHEAYLRAAAVALQAGLHDLLVDRARRACFLDEDCAASQTLLLYGLREVGALRQAAALESSLGRFAKSRAKTQRVLARVGLSPSQLQRMTDV